MILMDYYLWKSINCICTSFVELRSHHLTDLIPPFQCLNQTGQSLIICWVHQVTRRKGWKAFYELIQQTWVI